MTGLQGNHSRMDLVDGGCQDRWLQERDRTDRLPDVFDGTEQDLLEFGVSYFTIIY